MNNFWIYGLGFLAQILFFARTIAQWLKSEKEGEIISPVIFWQISLIGSFLMIVYGIFRNDFAIVLGQFIVYFIYIRNLQLKNAWKTMPVLVRIVASLIPAVILSWLVFGKSHNIQSILKNEEVSLFLLLWGSVGQIVFTFRFIYQWMYSEKHKDSILPLGFWIISTIGSLMIFAYAICRLDPVLFIAHSFGLFIYTRNILLYYGKNSLFSQLGKFPSINRIVEKISDRIK